LVIIFFFCKFPLLSTLLLTPIASPKFEEPNIITAAFDVGHCLSKYKTTK